MKTIKIIDLLNKIANGEELPNKFEYDNLTFKRINNYYVNEDGDSLQNSILTNFANLNDEVEIIEEDKKIEKLPYYSLEKIQKAKNKEEHYKRRIELLEKRVEDYHNKINELIDKVNSLENKQ